MKIILIRHARSIHKGGVVPPSDPEADLGDTPAFHHLAHHLPKNADWWVSPLGRCRMTMEKLCEFGVKPATIAYDDRLHEQDYGDFHGRPIAAVWAEVEHLPKSNWHFLHPETTPPNGESFQMLHRRTEAIIRDIESLTESLTESLAQPQSGAVLVILAHAMVNRSLIAHALNLGVDKALGFGCDPLSISEMICLGISDSGSVSDTSGGRWSLIRLNHTLA